MLIISVTNNENKTWTRNAQRKPNKDRKVQGGQKL